MARYIRKGRNQMADAKIVEKIAALLAKTVDNGASEQEAIAAAKMAQKLMAKYQVDAVTFEEKKEDVNDEMFGVTRNWQASLANVIAKNTCCRVIRTNNPNKRRGSAILFFGRDSDRKTAVGMWKMFAELIRQGIQRAKQAAMSRYGYANTVESSYAMRYIQAINEELGVQCRALTLVVPEEVDDAVHKKFPKLTTKTISYRVNSAGTMAGSMGYRDGKSAASTKRLR